MKKLLGLLVCLGLCLGMLCGCQGDQPKEGALTQPPELTLSTGKTQALLRSGSFPRFWGTGRPPFFGKAPLRRRAFPFAAGRKRTWAMFLLKAQRSPGRGRAFC